MRNEGENKAANCRNDGHTWGGGEGDSLMCGCRTTTTTTGAMSDSDRMMLMTSNLFGLTSNTRSIHLSSSAGYKKKRRADVCELSGMLHVSD